MRYILDISTLDNSASGAKQIFKFILRINKK